MAAHAIELPGATVTLDPAWMPAGAASALCDALMAGVPWERHRIRVYGREIDAPRLSCWMGDPDAVYTYSGTRFVPHPWPEVLVPVRERLEHELGAPFNSVLANLYRNGDDRLGWHRDGERELGPAPVIASLSLGGTRRFRLKSNDGSTTHGVDLTHGSLLVMSGQTQRNYVHTLPKTARAVGPRINLTFRHVIPRAAIPAP
jgi:alkylated DNA repair dioxygenase AlkB